MYKRSAVVSETDLMKQLSSGDKTAEHCVDLFSSSENCIRKAFQQHHTGAQSSHMHGSMGEEETLNVVGLLVYWEFHTQHLYN